MPSVIDKIVAMKKETIKRKRENPSDWHTIEESYENQLIEFLKTGDNAMKVKESNDKRKSIVSDKLTSQKMEELFGRDWRLRFPH